MIKLAVIGDPIEHSLSPWVHGGVMENLNIPYTYEKVQVKQGELQQFLDYAIQKEITGFNLTMPHKVDVLPFLDEIDEEAERFGAVNTVKIENGKLMGYNTDAQGYVLDLESKGYSFQNSRVVILGAGGVVRTLARKAAGMGAKEICICNRTKAKAYEIADLVSAETSVSVSVQGFSVEEICDAARECNILMNGTPLGMHGVERDFGDLSFLDVVPKSALVSDLIYNPEKTKLLQRAESLGLQTMNGLGMLIYQGILADEIYLNQALNKTDLCKKITPKLIEVLKGK